METIITGLLIDDVHCRIIDVLMDENGNPCDQYGNTYARVGDTVLRGWGQLDGLCALHATPAGDVAIKA